MGGCGWVGVVKAKAKAKEKRLSVLGEKEAPRKEKGLSQGDKDAKALDALLTWSDLPVNAS